MITESKHTINYNAKLITINFAWIACKIASISLLGVRIIKNYLLISYHKIISFSLYNVTYTPYICIALVQVVFHYFLNCHKLFSQINYGGAFEIIESLFFFAYCSKLFDQNAKSPLLKTSFFLDMIERMPYQNLNHALRYFKIQVIDSLPFANAYVPQFETPEQLFYWLKGRTTYKNDPPGVELFQTMQRLMTKNNFHGLAGAGDCDCFTIASLAACISQGWYNIGIVLTGRQPGQAVHIYQYIYFNGERYYLDLTNKDFNQVRSYPFYQELKFYVK